MFSGKELLKDFDNATKAKKANVRVLDSNKEFYSEELIANWEKSNTDFINEKLLNSKAVNGLQTIGLVPDWHLFNLWYSNFPAVSIASNKISNNALATRWRYDNVVSKEPDIVLTNAVNKLFNLDYLIPKIFTQIIIYGTAFGVKWGKTGKQKEVNYLGKTIKTPNFELNLVPAVETSDFFVNTATNQIEAFTWQNEVYHYTEFAVKKGNFYIMKRQALDDWYFGDSYLVPFFNSIDTVRKDNINYHTGLKNKSLPGTIWYIDTDKVSNGDEIGDTLESHIRAWREDGKFKSIKINAPDGSVRAEHVKMDLSERLSLEERREVNQDIFRAFQIPLAKAGYKIDSGLDETGHEVNQVDYAVDVFEPTSRICEKGFHEFYDALILAYMEKIGFFEQYNIKTIEDGKERTARATDFEFNMNSFETELPTVKSKRIREGALHGFYTNQEVASLGDRMRPDQLENRPGEFFIPDNVVVVKPENLKEGHGKRGGVVDTGTEVEDGREIDKGNDETAEITDSLNTEKEEERRAGKEEKTKNSKASEDLGCVMAVYNQDQFKQLTDKIDKNDLYSPDFDYHKSGIPTEFHTTLLYGLKRDVDVETVSERLHRHWKVSADIESEFTTIGELLKNKQKTDKLIIFENQDYDVLVIEMWKSEELVMANSQLTKLPYKNDYPDYTPHTTLAYLKKGTGKKYLNMDIPKIDFSVKDVVYGPAGTKEEFSLIKKTPAKNSKAKKFDLKSLNLKEFALKNKKESKKDLKKFEGVKTSDTEVALATDTAKKFNKSVEKNLKKQYNSVNFKKVFKELDKSKTKNSKANEELKDQIKGLVKKELPDLDTNTEEFILIALFIALLGLRKEERNATSQGVNPLTTDQVSEIGNDIKTFIIQRQQVLEGGKVKGKFENSLVDPNYEGSSLNETSLNELVEIITLAYLGAETEKERLAIVNREIEKRADDRAKKITTTELALLFAVGGFWVAKLLKGKKKEWLRTVSKQEREIHLEIVGQVVGFDENFTTGNYWSQEEINCKCGIKVLYV